MPLTAPPVPSEAEPRLAGWPRQNRLALIRGRPDWARARDGATRLPLEEQPDLG